MANEVIGRNERVILVQVNTKLEMNVHYIKMIMVVVSNLLQTLLLTLKLKKKRTNWQKC